MVSRIFRPPALGRLRFASVDDAPLILDLVNEPMSKTFRVDGTPQIVFLIENCILSIVQLDINGVIVGFLAARDYPLIPAVHSLSWEEYVWTKYKAVELNARNTLFLHLLCWNTIYARDLVDNMLKSVFMHDPYVHYIAFVKTMVSYPTLVPGQSRSEASFKRMQVIERGIPGDRLPALLVAGRVDVSPRLRIRRAVEEDNDDLVPIIERHSVLLKQMYGEFYISELISRHPESDRVLLVCEHKELAVGVMCLNTEINFEGLEDSFELSPFAGLRKVAQPLEHKRSKDQDSIISVHADRSAGDMTQGVHSDSRIQPKEMKSRVTWQYEVDDFKEFTGESPTPSPPSGQTVLSPLPQAVQYDVLNMLDEDEEEELEFDIINIDRDLLRVPKLLSYDALGRGPVESMMKLLQGGGRIHAETTEDKTSKKEKLKKLATTPGAPAKPAKPAKPAEPRRYTGAPNAFLLELFAVHPDYDERYGFDMLEVAFELFPDLDYCVLCLPSNHSSFPLLDHFTGLYVYIAATKYLLLLASFACFQLVTPYHCRMHYMNESLYVAHVNSVRGNVSVRPGEAFDVPALQDVLEHVPHMESLLDLFESTLCGSRLQSFVLLSQNQPIGMAVLGPVEDGTAIRTQFDLDPEPRRPGTDGTVLAGVMSPALEPHGRWFMRELLRQSAYSTLFWICRLFAKGDAAPSRNLMSLAGHMAPVHPRRSMPNISGSKDLDKLFKELATPFALWVLERPLSCLPKVFVNNSIVVVGASSTGLAFLETLLLGPTAQYLTFSNVTLVSEHGLPTVTECLRAADTCVPSASRYSDRYIKSVPFYFYVDVMSAIMVGIDRKKKCIMLKGGGVKYYDELVLTCGQQFQHPDYLTESLELVKEIEKGKPWDRLLMDNPKYLPDSVPPPSTVPENVMLINSLFNANVCLRKLMCMISDAKETKGCLSDENQVVVYGECLEAYSCVAALLELGLEPQVITFVEPFPPEEPAELRVNCFNNETVDERVQSKIERLGVRVLRQCQLAGWRQTQNHVEALHFMSTLQATRLPCFALFYYGRRAIDLYAFKAINECGLVYDGGLVVGPKFDTNDPHIYGAGKCVRYSRRLYASRHLHCYYNSEDIGESLANIFLRKMDPFMMVGSENNLSDTTPRYSSSLLAFRESRSSLSSATRLSLACLRRGKWEPVKKYGSPIINSATLPGPLYYMKARKPGIEIPMEVQMSLPHQGHTLITDKRGNYFRLQLNVLHCVDSVICLSKQPFSTDVLGQLYGKHEAFFDKLLTRFMKNEIDDLYNFFTRPWMAALYQETFRDLLNDINEQDVGTVYDLVRSRYSIYNDSSKASVEDASRSFSTCSTVPSCGFGPKEAKNLGTFRSVIDRFVARVSSSNIVTSTHPSDIPSECGQSPVIRADAASFWKTVGGERIVMAHLQRYLARNSVTNPHYATPKPEFN